MERFFARVDPKGGIAYIEEDFNHFRAKRVKVGETVVVLDKESFTPYRGKVQRVEKRRAVVSIEEKLPPKGPEVFIRLYQCVPVSLSTFDEIVDKATQVGVSQIVPVISKRSYQKRKVVEEKIPRWERVAMEALKQCQRDLPPQILPQLPLEEIEPEGDFLNLFPFERERGRNLLEVLCSVKEEPKGVNIVIGPEGGFTKEEALLLGERGFIPTSLGPFILRAETAATVAPAIVYNYFTAGIGR